MDQKDYRHIQRELEECYNARTALLSTTDFKVIAREWKRFLFSSDLVYNKLRRALEKHPKGDPWMGRKTAERKNDKLLAYIHQAKNSHSHTLQELVSTATGYTISVETAGVTQSFHADPHAKEQPKIVITPESLIHITKRPECVRLLEVINKGTTYPVPTKHLGAPLQDQSIKEVTGHAYLYLRDMVDEAKQFVI